MYNTLNLVFTGEFTMSFVIRQNTRLTLHMEGASANDLIFGQESQWPTVD